MSTVHAAVIISLHYISAIVAMTVCVVIIVIAHLAFGYAFII
jgi:hypothetical protein